MHTEGRLANSGGDGQAASSSSYLFTWVTFHSREAQPTFLSLRRKRKLERSTTQHPPFPRTSKWTLAKKPLSSLDLCCLIGKRQGEARLHRPPSVTVRHPIPVRPPT